MATEWPIWVEVGSVCYALIAAGVDKRHLYSDEASGARDDRADVKERGIAFRSLTEQMDTTTPHGELLFSLFGALAQYERALTRERSMAGLAAAKRRGRQGGRPPKIDAEKIEQITAALAAGVSKASVCRTFNVPRSTLTDTLKRIG